MNVTTKTTFPELLNMAIRDYVQKRTAEEFDAKKTELIASLDKRKDEIVAAACIDIMNQVDIATMLDRVVITVRKIEPLP